VFACHLQFLLPDPCTLIPTHPRLAATAVPAASADPSRDDIQLPKTGDRPFSTRPSHQNIILTNPKKSREFRGIFPSGAIVVWRAGATMGCRSEPTRRPTPATGTERHNSLNSNYVGVLLLLFGPVPLSIPLANQPLTRPKRIITSPKVPGTFSSRRMTSRTRKHADSSDSLTHAASLHPSGDTSARASCYGETKNGRRLRT